MVRSTRWRVATVFVAALVTLAGGLCALDREAGDGQGFDLCALFIAVAGPATPHPTLALVGQAALSLAPLLLAVPPRGIDPPPKSRLLPA